ncbi:MAG: FAD-binding protein [Clostridiaceae bacterium]|nr:FAD-binding protein [Clostridiaceae bacterium]
MKKDIVSVDDLDIKIFSLNTVIAGSGAAGLNAADTLYSMGQTDIAIVTEGLLMGTSRNTGSDKQTYYKLTLSGDSSDSVVAMAETYFNGGCMHGDIALIEAALSPRCFFKLVDIGVPFPHNKYGEYVGYKTDHDPRQRATSAGPLTSRFMTEKLEMQVKNKGIKIFDGYQVIGILIEKTNGETKATGLVTLDKNAASRGKLEIVLFNCTNIIYATGGPAGMYLTSVYPKCHMGASGIAFEAGARGINLTESQYGIASVKFRWNLSGTYQQVLPRYISTNPDGIDPKEFLNEYFDTPGQMLDAIFLKGYQWPFDPGKIENHGSSIIDILVYNETRLKGRRVFLDFTKNPQWGSIDGKLDFSLLGKEAYEYLEKSGALFGTPVERLAKMNMPAIELYKYNGIDITKEYLEIDVCAQHNNGGLVGNIWWESNIKHLFPVGEVNGVFGVYRPGGSALNSTQVGSVRASMYIIGHYNACPPEADVFFERAKKQITDRINIAKSFVKNLDTQSNVLELRKKYQERMTRHGAHIRSAAGVEHSLAGCRKDLKDIFSKTRLSSLSELPDAFINRDILLSQFVYLSASDSYIKKGGTSRGSYLITSEKGRLPHGKLGNEFKFIPDSKALLDQVCEIELKVEDGDYKCITEWKPVRPIPKEDNWFENVWNEYRKGNIMA